MPKRKTLIKIVLFLLFIILIVLGIYFYCEKKLAIKEVYVAKYNLSNRSLISEEEIETKRVPLSYLSEEIYLNKEDIVGKYVKINTIVPKGSFFYRGALDTLDNMKDKLASDLLTGEVSFDIYARDIKANQAYLLKGMYVDLYLTINKDRVLSDLLINNLKIIGLYDINHNEIKDYDNNTILETIVLAVPKEAVSYLNKAQVIGELSLVIGENTYKDVKTELNRSATIFEYLE